MEIVEAHAIFACTTIDLKYVHTQITSSPDECRQWLQKYGLLASSKVCDCGIICSLVRHSNSPDGSYWKCTQPRCRKRYDLRVGSFFENSDLPLRTLVELLYWWSKDIRLSVFRREFNAISDDEIMDWFNLCRDFCVHVLFDINKNPIGGVDVVVEVNISRSFYRGETHDEAIWMLGLVERDNPGNSILLPCPGNKTDPASLLPVIQQHVLPGTTVLTDEYSSFNDLQDVKATPGSAKSDGTGSVSQSNGKRKDPKEIQISDSYLYAFVWRRKYKERIFEHLISFICNYHGF